MYLNFILKNYILLKKCVPKALKLYMLIRIYIFKNFQTAPKLLVRRIFALKVGFRSASLLLPLVSMKQIAYLNL
jgi:hypothetical protein